MDLYISTVVANRAVSISFLCVAAAAIPTYNALADHAGSTTGECWPMMETLARILGRTAKTIQRHLRILEEAGLVEILERRRDGKGRFLGFKFRRPHPAGSTRTGGSSSPPWTLDRRNNRLCRHGRASGCLPSVCLS